MPAISTAGPAERASVPSPSAMNELVEARTAELSRALALVETQKRELEAELEDARLLHGISAMLVDENSIGDLYQRLVDAATLLMRSDFGSMQRYDEERGELQLIAQRGLNDEAIAFWQWVHPGRATTCGRALELGQRVVVDDFERCDFIAGSEDLVAFRKAGVRAAQSTPLLTRTGRLVGMITTHWLREHAPGERELRLFDIIARQAADLIERNLAMEALRAQAEHLLAADRYKNEFLATLAHELRNPLAPIRTGLNVLRLGRPEQAPRVLGIMERQLGHMVRLIDDLLDVSRISSGKVTLQRARAELGGMIDSAVDASRPLISAADHRFTVTMPGTPIWIDADATRIAQIVSNLLNNAAKYTPRGGRIDLVVEPLDDAVTVRVIDNGIGIAASMLPRIFDLFTQVDSAIERSQGGLGVGLALARRLAEMHDGAIEAASGGANQGSVFTLRVPLAADPVHAAIAPDALPAQGASRRILIVDDNVDAAETLALLLEGMGHVAQVVTEAPAAVAAALAFRPDVMFLDLGMPALNGYDLARLLRAEPELRQVCLAALSGWGTEDHRARSRAAGIDHHLTKPVLLTDVNQVLETAARQHWH